MERPSSTESLLSDIPVVSTSRTRQAIRCPEWERPTLMIVPNGIEYRCNFCGKRHTHTVTREELERAWEAMEQVAKDDILIEKGEQ